MKQATLDRIHAITDTLLAVLFALCLISGFLLVVVFLFTLLRA